MIFVTYREIFGRTEGRVEREYFNFRDLYMQIIIFTTDLYRNQMKIYFVQRTSAMRLYF